MATLQNTTSEPSIAQRHDVLSSTAGAAEKAKVAPLTSPDFTRTAACEPVSAPQFPHSCSSLDFSSNAKPTAYHDTAYCFSSTVFPHPVYTFLAILSPTALSVARSSGAAINFQQVLFDPYASPCDSSKPRFPIRLNDASAAFEKNSSFSYQVLDSSCDFDYFLSASWHRDSLTLAVGSCKALFIFTGHAADGITFSLPTFECSFYTRLQAPCHTLFWLNDQLLTNAAAQSVSPSDADGRSMGHAELFRLCRDTSTCPLTSWSGQFKRTIPAAHPRDPTAALSTADITSGADISEAVIAGSSMLRHHWVSSNTPLAVFVRMMPFARPVGWSHVVGTNTLVSWEQKLLSDAQGVREMYDKKTNQKAFYRSFLDRLVPHPSGRFLAVLYGLSASNLPHESGHARPPLSKNSCFSSIPSPTVRIWASSLRETSDLEPPLLFLTQNACQPLFASSDVRSSTDEFPAFSAVGISRHCFHEARHKEASETLLNRKDTGVAKQRSAMELQQPEWELLELYMQWQVAVTKSEKPELRNPLPHQHSVLHFMAFQDWLEQREDDAIYGLKGQQDISSDITGHPDALEENCHAHTSELVPLLFDGPYCTTSLNHRAPVVDVFWRDPGSTLDTVFVPAVLCALTLDNHLTVWVESSFQTSLRFEAVILVSLHSLTRHLNASTPGVVGSRNLTPWDVTGELSPNDSASCLLSESQPSNDLLRTVCARQYNSKWAMCWLSCNRVSYNAPFAHNFIRLARAEKPASFTALDVLQWGDLLPHRSREDSVSNDDLSEVFRINDLSYSVDKGDVVVVEKPHTGQSSFCTLPLKHNVHVRLEGHRVTPNTSHGYSSDWNVASLQAECQLPSFPVVMLPSPQGRQSVEFLLITETAVDNNSEPWQPVRERPGLWVYAFRDLEAQYRTSCAVRLLLEPKHLPLPCRVRSIVMAECIPSLGLSAALWEAEHTAFLHGRCTAVFDGLLFPPCCLTLLSVSGELWTCIIRPCLDEGSAGGNDAETVFTKGGLNPLLIRYTLMVSHIHGFYPLNRVMYRAANVDLQRSVVKRRNGTESFLTGLTPRGVSYSNFAADRSHLVWNLIEEHPHYPRLYLALNSYGRLAFGHLPLKKFFFDCQSSSPFLSSTETAQSTRRISASSQQEDVGFFRLPRGKIYSPALTLAQFHNALDNAPVSRHITFAHTLTSSTTTSSVNVTVSDDYTQRETTQQTVANPNPYRDKSAACGTTFDGCRIASLPLFRHAIWLPFSDCHSSPVALVVVEPKGHLMALEFEEASLGSSSVVRHVPFIGHYCRSFLAIHHALEPTAVFAADPYNATVAHVEASCLGKDDGCLVLLCVTLSCKESESDTRFSVGEKEHHVLLLRCYNVYAKLNNDHSSSQRIREALKFDVLFDGFLQATNDSESANGFQTFVPIAPASSTLSLPSEQVHCPSNNAMPSSWSFPQLSLSRNAYHREAGTFGLFASYPVLDTFPTPLASSSKNCFVAVYELFSSVVRLLAYAVVNILPMPNTASPTSPIDSVVAVSICNDNLAVLTSRGNLFLYSFLTLNPYLDAPSRPEGLVTLAAQRLELQFNSFSCRKKEPFFLRPIQTVSLRNFLLQLELLVFSRKRLASLSKRKAVRHSACSSPSSSPRSQYFSKPANPFDALEFHSQTNKHRAKFDASASRYCVHASSIENCASSDFRLSPHRIGRPSLLSFYEITGCEALSLLIALRFEPPADSGSEDAPVSVPVLLSRYWNQGAEHWAYAQSLPHIAPQNTVSPSLAAATVVWSGAQTPASLLVSLLPPMSSLLGASLLPPVCVTPVLDYFCRCLASFYHPEALVAQIKRADGEGAMEGVWVTLKKLHSLLLIWRKEEKHAAVPAAQCLEQEANHRDGTLLTTRTLYDHGAAGNSEFATSITVQNVLTKKTWGFDRFTAGGSKKGFEVVQADTLVWRDKTENSVIETFNNSRFSESLDASSIKHRGSTETDVDFKPTEGLDAAAWHSVNFIRISDLEQLINWTNVLDERNVELLQQHCSLVPHLSFCDTVALWSLLRFLLPLLHVFYAQQPATPQKRCTAAADLLGSISWGLSFLPASVQQQLSPSVDIFALRYLVGYGIMLANNVSCKSVVDASHQEPFRSLCFSCLKFWSSTNNLQPDEPNFSLDTTTLLLQYQLELVSTPLMLNSSDIAWAVHSQEDNVLLDQVFALYLFWTSRASASSPLLLSWDLLRQAGAGLWLRHPQTVLAMASERLPKDTYRAQTNAAKNLDDIALWYIATDRLPLLRLLYKVDKANAKTLEFLNRDFSVDRWREAASKNAYALLKQRRYTLALSFFLLARQFIEAIHVCCEKMDDLQLALFLATVLDVQTKASSFSSQSMGPDTTQSCLRDHTLKTKLLPKALEARDRCLESAVFWLLSQFQNALLATLPHALRPQEKDYEQQDGLKSNVVLPSESLLWLTGNTSVEATATQLNSNEIAGHSFIAQRSILLNASPLSLPSLRNHLANANQLKRIISEISAAELFHWFQQAFDALSEGNAHSNEVSGFAVSRHIFCAVLLCCQDVLHFLDLGDSILFAIRSRLHFRALQLCHEISFLPQLDCNASLFFFGFMSQLRWTTAITLYENVALPFLQSYGLSNDDLQSLEVVLFGASSGTQRRLPFSVASWRTSQVVHDISRIVQPKLLTSVNTKSSPLPKLPLTEQHTVWTSNVTLPLDYFQKAQCSEFQTTSHYSACFHTFLRNYAKTFDLGSSLPESLDVSKCVIALFRLSLEVLEQLWQLHSEQELAARPRSSRCVTLIALLLLVSRNISSITSTLSNVLVTASSTAEQDYFVYLLPYVMLSTMILSTAAAVVLLTCIDQRAPADIDARPVSVCWAQLAQLVSQLQLYKTRVAAIKLCCSFQTPAASSSFPSTFTSLSERLLASQRCLLSYLGDDVFTHCLIMCGYTTLAHSTSSSSVSLPPVVCEEIHLWYKNPKQLVHLAAQAVVVASCLSNPIDHRWYKNASEHCYSENRDISVSLWTMLFGLLRLSLFDVVATWLVEVVDGAEIVFRYIQRHQVSEEHNSSETNAVSEEQARRLFFVSHRSFRSISAGCRRWNSLWDITTHSSYSVHLYMHLIVTAFIKVPFLLTAISNLSHDQADGFCAALAVLSGGISAEASASFLQLWLQLGCTLRLQLFFSRGPSLGLPQCLTNGGGLLHSLRVPNVSLVFGSMRHPPIAIEVDRAYGFPHMYSFPLLGSPGLLPYGLNVYNGLTNKETHSYGNGSTCFPPGFGVLSVSNEKGVSELSLFDGLLFSFDSTTPSVTKTHSRDNDPQKEDFDEKAAEFCCLIREIMENNNAVAPMQQQRVLLRLALQTLLQGTEKLLPLYSEEVKGENETTLHTLRDQQLLAQMYDEHLSKLVSSASMNVAHNAHPTASPSFNHLYSTSLISGNTSVHRETEDVSTVALDNSGLIKENSAYCSSPAISPSPLSVVSLASDATDSGQQFHSSTNTSQAIRRSMSQHTVKQVKPHWYSREERFLDKGSNHISSNKTAQALRKIPSKRSRTLHFRTSAEFFLRGCFNPVADMGFANITATLQKHLGRHVDIKSPHSFSRLFAQNRCLFFTRGFASLPVLCSNPKLVHRHPTPQKTLPLEPGSFKVSPAKASATWVSRVAAIEHRAALQEINILRSSCLMVDHWLQTFGQPYSSNDSGGYPELMHCQSPKTPMSVLRAHPWLPVCAGAIADTQVITTPSIGTPVIMLWTFSSPCTDILGFLALTPASPAMPSSSGPSKSIRPTEAPHSTSVTTADKAEQPAVTCTMDTRTDLSSQTLAAAHNEHQSQEKRGRSTVTRAPERSEKEGKAVLRPKQQLFDVSSLLKALPLQSGVRLTYQEAGPIKSLRWCNTGTRLVSAHNNGWVCLWNILFDLPACAPEASGPSAPAPPTPPQKPTSSANPVEPQSNARSFAQTSNTAQMLRAYPAVSFRPHTTSCRFAACLSDTNGAQVGFLITSGRGLSPTPLTSHGGYASRVVSAEPENGAVCIWNLDGNQHLGLPQLLAADTSFTNGNYATDLIVWATRQCILYSDCRGQVRIMHLRCFSDVALTIVCPQNDVQRLALHTHKRYNDAVPSLYYDESTGMQHSTSSFKSTPGTATAGTISSMEKEIVRIFLLAETQRLVTCYEDAMIRVWDLSKLCSAQYVIATPESPHRFLQLDETQQLASGTEQHSVHMYRRIGCLEKAQATENINHSMLPLLWETPRPVHQQDTSKLSLLSSLLGTVFNIAPSGQHPRTLLDARMAGASHVITLGADASVVVTRI